MSHDDYKKLDDLVVLNECPVCGYATVRGYAMVCGYATVRGYAEVKKSLDIQCYQGVGSENGTLTACRAKDGSVIISRGCFEGDLEKFRDAVHQKHGSSKIGKHYLGICNLIALWFDLPELIEP